MLSVDELRSEAEAGTIDTVVAAFTVPPEMATVPQLAAA